MEEVVISRQIAPVNKAAGAGLARIADEFRTADIQNRGVHIQSAACRRNVPFEKTSGNSNNIIRISLTIQNGIHFKTISPQLCLNNIPEIDPAVIDVF